MIDPKKIGSKYRLVLLKTQKAGGQELGMLIIIDGPLSVFNCVTLQLADILGDGTYSVEPYLSPKSGKKVLLLTGVPGHSYLEIHIGNFKKDTQGCVIPGRFFQDINGDGLPDVVCSGETMKMILTYITEKTTILVKTV